MGTLLGAAVLGLGTFGFGIPSSASEIARLFEESAERSTVVGTSAEQMVRSAFERLFPNEFGMEIETVRRGVGADGEIARFRVYRRNVDGEDRILTESLAPTSIAGSRMLQVETSSGNERTFAYVRSAAPEPFATTFRLADPFLCSWYDKNTKINTSRRPRTAADEAAYRPPFEILGRRPDRLQGEPVQRILLRPLIDRGYDHAEFAIAESDFAILEYRYFAVEGDPEPSLIARASREDMVLKNGYLLPTVLRYEDRALNQTIEVSVVHQPLPAEIPDTLFDPRSFHRPRTEPLAPSTSR